jgi:aminopeptidase-like protein
VISYDAWGSDHVPYLDHGLQAVLAIENDYGSYPHYHRTTDTPDHLTTDMAIETLKMNIAVIAHLAGSDGGVLFADGFESGGMGRWSQTVN